MFSLLPWSEQSSLLRPPPLRRERKDKLARAKRVAATISRSNLSIEARQVARERNELDAIRKRAKFIAQQSATFWSKAQRVCSTKVRSSSTVWCQPPGARPST